MKKHIITLLNFFYLYIEKIFERITLKEKIIPIYEIDVYLEEDIKSSITNGVKFSGNRRRQVILRRFVKKEKMFRKVFYFFRKYFPKKEISRKVFNDYLLYSAERFINLANLSRSLDGNILFVKGSDPTKKIIWKIYLRDKIDEPREFEILNSVGYSISNSL